MRSSRERIALPICNNGVPKGGELLRMCWLRAATAAA